MNTVERDRAWLEDLFRSYRPAVYAYAARRTHIDEVEDLVAEVFTTAWRSRDSVPDDPLPWLYRVARNHLRHAKRGRARQLRITDRVGAGEHLRGEGTDVEGLVSSHVDVLSVLAQLPEADAEILRLAASEELSASEIAVVLGCSTAAARVRLHRARKRARNVLAAVEGSSAQTQPRSVPARIPSSSFPLAAVPTRLSAPHQEVQA